MQNVPPSQRFRHHCGNDRRDTARSSPPRSRFKYVYSARASLQAATCFLLSRLHHEATAEMRQITAACCSHPVCTSLHLNSGLCTSVIYTCADFFSCRCYFVLVFSRSSFSLRCNEEGKRTEERPKCLSDH